MSDLMPDDNERAEAAWHVWLTDGNQDAAKTAAITGIPVRTIRYYAQTRDWMAKLNSMAGAEAGASAVRAHQMMRAGMPMVVQRMLRIVGEMRPLRTTNGELVRDPTTGETVMVPASEDRDAIQAAKVLSMHALAGVTYEGEANASEGLWRHGGEALENQSLQAQAAAILEATVADVNTRQKKGRRV
jgi:hypothetical protein